MFQRLIDDFKDSTGTALRLTSLAAAAAVALLVTTSFLCAAAFVFVLKKYGPVEACLTGAGIFFVVTMIAAISYVVRKKQIEKRVKETTKSAAQTMLADPMLVAAGIQVVRAIGHGMKVGVVQFVVTGKDGVVHSRVVQGSEPVSGALPGDLAAVAGRLLGGEAGGHGEAVEQRPVGHRIRGLGRGLDLGLAHAVGAGRRARGSGRRATQAVERILGPATGLAHAGVERLAQGLVGRIRDVLAADHRIAIPAVDAARFARVAGSAAIPQVAAT